MLRSLRRLYGSFAGARATSIVGGGSRTADRGVPPSTSTTIGTIARSASVSTRTTVIIPTYNRCEYLGEALRSVLGQTLGPLRVIVVDDGSTDGTPAVAGAFGGRVDYRRQANSGKSSALNAALSTVDEGFVWIFDDDDIAEPDALDRMEKALIDRPDCGFAYGAFDTFKSTPGGQRRVYVRGHVPPTQPASLFAALLELCHVFQGGMLVRRSAYDDVGPFDETLVRSQDYEMILRLARRFDGAKVEAVLFHQRQHPGRRGTAAVPIAARELNAVLRDYDLKIFPELFRTLEISEYGGGSEEGLVRLARRSVVFARKDLWNEATAGLIDYLAEAERLGRERLTAAEAAIFRSTFDLFSRGDLRKSKPFQAALAAARPKRFRGEIRAAMLRHLNHRIRRAVLTRSREDFLRYTTIFILLCCPRSLDLHLRSTINDKLAAALSLRPWKRLRQDEDGDCGRERGAAGV